jgi:plasmid stabilization system protein ParE
VNDDLARLLAALETAADPRPVGDRLAAAVDDALAEQRGRGRPPALTPEQVRSIRRRRSLPLDRRPRLTELAAEFRVDVVTVRKAVQARPPYDDGEAAPPGGGRHRDRGSGRFS